jgi:hypothetical protein
MEIVERNKDWIIPLSRAKLDVVQVDYRLILKVSSANEQVQITIETSAQMIDSQGLSVELEPEDAKTLCPALSLVNAEIDEVAITEHGLLSVSFIGGLRLQAPPHEEYEAWQISSNSFLVVCPPGGGVTIFKEQAKNF